MAELMRDSRGSLAQPMRPSGNTQTNQRASQRMLNSPDRKRTSMWKVYRNPPIKARRRCAVIGHENRAISPTAREQVSGAGHALTPIPVASPLPPPGTTGAVQGSLGGGRGVGGEGGNPSMTTRAA